MSRYRRSLTGRTYFFTVVSHRRQPILCDAPIRLALRQAVVTVRTAHPFSIDGFVLLPDHLHCIWTLPEGDNDFSIRWSEIKRFVSSFAPAEYRDAGMLTRSRSTRTE